MTCSSTVSWLRTWPKHETIGRCWVKELLLDLPMGERPLPFKRLEHTFTSLESCRLADKS
jgi:hypothetical protein